MVVLDLGTRWRDCYPSAERDATQSRLALQCFIGPRTKVKTFQCDGARELYRAAVDLCVCPTTSRPYVSQSNSLVERAIRHVEEGTRTVLLHAGLPPQWWPFAAKYFCFACNTDESQGSSPWSLRHGPASFKGILCPFGAMVDFLPPKPYLARLPKFGPRGVPGIFLGYHLHHGGHFRGNTCV